MVQGQSVARNYTLQVLKPSLDIPLHGEDSDRRIISVLVESVAAGLVVRGTRDVEDFVHLAKILVGIGDNQVNSGRVVVVAAGEIVVVGVQVLGHGYSLSVSGVTCP